MLLPLRVQSPNAFKLYSSLDHQLFTVGRPVKDWHMRQGRSNRARMDPPRPSPGPNTWRRHFSSVPHHIAVSDIITLSCTIVHTTPYHVQCTLYTQRFPLLLYRAFRFGQNMNSSAVRLWLVAHAWRPKAVHWQHSALKRLFPSSCPVGE